MPSLSALVLTAASALAQAPVRLGALSAVSGSARFWGTPKEKTLGLQVQEAHARGGDGCQIGLISLDTASDFRPPANDQVAVPKFLIQAEHLWQKNSALLTVSDSLGCAGRGLSVADEAYSPQATVPPLQLQKSTGSKPDAITCGGTNPGFAIIPGNLPEFGVKTSLFQSHGIASQKFIEPAGPNAALGYLLPAEKLEVCHLLHKHAPRAKRRKPFAHSHGQVYGVETSSLAGYACDGSTPVAVSLKKGGPTAARVHDGSEHTGQLVGVFGTST